MDTNALMMPVELGVRVFEELDRVLGLPADGYELVAPRAVVEELEALAAGSRGEEGVAARVGADLGAERCRTVETEASYADDAVVELAERGECDYVVTNDRPLRDRVLERGVRVIGIRGRNRLHITEP
ncbi:PIN domain-containing protein [Halegenticoccus soli]|uniref:PIN domain-containing protein n=1 Tax=Halegenticoccus soli TaxID=1985678 RepID=UPI000C6E1386